MSAHMILVFAMSSALISFISADSSVTLVGDPTNIHPVLTKTLQIRCAIQNINWLPKTTSLYTVITTGQPGDTTVSTQQGAAHNISSDQDISKLLSLVITKVNQKTGLSETLVSVTGCSTPVIEEKFLSTFQAEGSTEGSNQDGEFGYLVLSWNRPDSDKAGKFSCEAYALNTDKHPISLSVDLEVTSVEPSIADLATYISAAERQIDSLRSMINDVAGETISLREQNGLLLVKAAELEERLSDLKGQNIQTGTFSCYYQQISFPQPYNDTPLVFFAPYTESLYSSSYSYISASYSVSIYSITPDNFTVSCSQSYYSNTFSWLAIDN